MKGRERERVRSQRDRYIYGERRIKENKGEGDILKKELNWKRERERG